MRQTSSVDDAEAAFSQDRPNFVELLKRLWRCSEHGAYETVATGSDSSMVKLYLVTGVFTGVINVTVIFQWNDILFTII